MNRAGGTQRLPQLIGLAKAKELIYSGDIIDAATALSNGLLNRFHAADSWSETMKFAEKLTRNSFNGMRCAKSLIDYSLSNDM